MKNIFNTFKKPKTNLTNKTFKKCFNEDQLSYSIIRIKIKTMFNINSYHNHPKDQLSYSIILIKIKTMFNINNYHNHPKKQSEKISGLLNFFFKGTINFFQNKVKLLQFQIILRKSIYIQLSKYMLNSNVMTILFKII